MPNYIALEDCSEGYLRALREYPFYRFDYERVRVRAYFLGEDRPHEPAANWLEAERYESHLQGHLALGFSPASTFLEDFELCGHIRFKTNQPASKDVWHRESPRRCAVCGKCAPEVTFRTDAHLLPACTGNRHIYTAAECDGCNLKLGRETENHLGAMLTPFRSMSAIQTRTKPSTKYRREKPGSSVGGQDRGEPLEVVLQEGSDWLKVKRISSQGLQLDMRALKYRPVAALRSLGRTAWHLLSPAERLAHPLFLEWVQGKTQSVPMTYAEVVVPGPGLAHTTFAVWRRRRGGDDNPEIVFMLAMGSVAIVVPYPAAPRPTLDLPPLPASPYGLPNAKILTIKHDGEVEPKREFVLRFLSASLLQLAEPTPVTLSITTQDRERRTLKSVLQPFSTTDPRGQVVYDFHGGDLCGAARIVSEPLQLGSDGQFSGGRVDLQMGVDGDPPHDDLNACGRTVDFSAKCAAGGLLTVELTDSARVLVAAVLPAVGNEVAAETAAAHGSGTEQ